MDSDSSDRRFVLYAKRWFLTYPRCDSSVDNVLANVRRLFIGRLQWCVVVGGPHKDGGHHLHAAISFTHRFRFYDTEALDALAGSHGNYQPLRKMAASMRYLLGHHPELAEYGINANEYCIAREKRVAKPGKFLTCAEMIRTGAQLSAVEDWDPGFFLAHMAKIREYFEYVELRRGEQEKEPWRGLEGPYQHLTDDLVATWLNENLAVERTTRSKHLWLWGPPRHGKSTLVSERLARFFKIYYMVNEDWFGTYRDDLYDVAFIDEFDGTKTIQFMNKWLQGVPMRLKIKGREAFLLKKQHIPTVITANDPPESFYEKASDGMREAFLSRLEVVHCYDPINVLLDDRYIKQ